MTAAGTTDVHLFVSRDEGVTWEVVEPQNDPKFVNVPNPNVFGIRDGTPEILRRFMDSRLAVDDLVEPYGSDPIEIPTFAAELFVTSADRGWVAGLAQLNGQLSWVLASGSKGAGWLVQDIGPGGDVRLDGMDFQEGTRGLACGSATESANEAPFCVFTNDGGESWTRSELPPDVDSVGTPVRTAGDTGIVVASTTDDGVVFLQTTDGGRSFHRGAPPAGDVLGVFRFARSSRIDEGRAGR